MVNHFHSPLASGHAQKRNADLLTVRKNVLLRMDAITRFDYLANDSLS